MKRLLLTLGFIPTIALSQTILFSEDFDSITPNLQNPGSELSNQTEFTTTTFWGWNVPSGFGTFTSEYLPGDDHCLFIEQGSALWLESPCVATRTSPTLPIYLSDNSTPVITDCTGNCGGNSILTLPEVNISNTEEEVWFKFDWRTAHYGGLDVEISCDDGEWETLEHFEATLLQPWTILDDLETYQTNLSLLECERIQIRFVAYGGGTSEVNVNYSFIDNIIISTPEDPQITSVETIGSNKNIVKIVNIHGQEVPFNTQGILIYIYSDGTTEKKFNTNNFN